MSTSFFPYEGFLEVLRDNGFSVGIDSFMRVQTLTNRINSQTGSEELKYLLCPLFARNEKEQKKFYRLYDNYFQLVEQHMDELAQGLIPEPVPEEPSTPKPKVRFRPNWTQISRWGFALLSILVSIYLVHLLRETYLTMKGDQNKMGAFDYLQKYELNKNQDYVIHLLRYLRNDLLGQPQACDSLEVMDFVVESTSLHPEGGYQVSFLNRSLDTLSSQVWDFGDSSEFSTLVSPKHVYTDTGTYPVSLMIQNQYGCRASIERLVRVEPPRTCWADFSYFIDPADDQVVHFSDSSLIKQGDVIVDWSWQLGDKEQTTASGASVDMKYPQYTSYKVCLKIETKLGCVDSICEIIGLEDPTHSQTLYPLQDPPFFGVDIQQLSSPNGLFFWLFAAIFLVVGGIFYELYKLTRRRLMQTQPRSSTGPFTWNLSYRPQPHIFGTSLLHKVATNLRQRQQSNLLILDMAGTIEDTIEAGGYPNFRFEAGSRPSEYLVLIEQRSGRDHQAKLFQTLMDQLASQDVYVDQFFFRSHPQVVYKEGSDAPIYLHDLKTRYPDHRLLIFGDGEGLIDPVSGEFQPTFFELLDWVDRAILTPLPPIDWGFQEISLAQKFLVLPATSASLMVLLEEFDDDKDLNIRRWQKTDSPSPDWEEEQSISTLRAYLGEQTFQWLAACSVYPEVHWDLTLALGKELESLSTDTAGSLLAESNILSLARLPYFRSGGIPDKLRLTLVDTLDEDTLTHIRELIVEILAQNPPPEGSIASERQYRHEVCQKWELAQGSWGSRRKIREQMEEWVERDEIEDVVVLRDLGKKRDMRMPGKGIPSWGKWAFRHGVPLLGIKSWLRIAAVLLAFGLIITNVYQERVTWDSLLEFRQWLRNPGNIVQIENRYYRLANSEDSARYFSYLGGVYYQQEDFGSAYNHFKGAIELQPLGQLYRYQFGLANYQLSKTGPSSQEWERAYEEFSLAGALTALYSEQTNLQLQWDLEDDRINVATLSEDGNFIALALDQEVRIIHRVLDSVIASWPIVQMIDELRFSPDSRFILQVEGTACALYNCMTGERLGVYDEHSLDINTAVFSSNGSYVVTSSEDHAAIVWRKDSWAQFHVLEDIHYGAVTDASFSYDGTRIITASEDSSAVIWDLFSGDFLTELFGQNAPLSLARFLPDNRMTITGSNDGNILLWDRNGEKLKTISLASREIAYMDLVPDGSALVSIQARTEEEALSIHLWDFYNNRLIKHFGTPLLEKFALDNHRPQQKGMSTVAMPSFKFGRDGRLLLVIVPEKGVELYEFEQLHTDSIRRFSQFNQSLTLYQRQQFQKAYDGFDELTRDELIGARAETWYARGISALYVAAEKGKAGDPEAFRTAIQSFDQALTIDPASVEKIGKLIPILHETFTLAPEVYVQERRRMCDLLSKYHEDACAIFKFDEIRPFQEGRAAVRIKDKWGYIDTLQRLVVVPQYATVDDYLRGMAFVANENGQLEAVDLQGERIYAQVGTPSEGLVAVQDLKSKLWGYLEVKTHLLVIGSLYEEAASFSLGYAKVKRDGKYGFIDKHGNEEVYGGIVYDIIKGEFKLSKILMANRDGKSTKISYQAPEDQISQGGEFLENEIDTILVNSSLTSQFPDQVSVFTIVGEESNNRIRAIQNGKYGYLKPAMNVVVQIPYASEASPEVVIGFQYENAQDFRFERAAVKSAGGKWGYIDPTGKEVIPFVFDRADYFGPSSDGDAILALVAREGRQYYIDLDGDCVDLPHHPCLIQMNEKKAIYVPEEYQDKESGLIGIKLNGKWGLLTAERDTLLRPIYETSIRFINGVAKVSRNGKWGFIDQNGKEIIPLEYDLVQDFSEGLAAVLKNGKWGYIDQKNRVRIFFKFEEANPFRSGKAVVKEDGKSSRIDESGRPAANRIKKR